MVLTETWLGNHVDSRAFCLPNFSIYRKDRTSLGGGVAILARDTICSSPVESPSSDSFEICSVDLRYNMLNFRLICCYLPPNSNSSVVAEFIASLTVLLHGAALSVICGDFNIKDIDWDIVRPYSRVASLLAEFVLDEGLFQSVFSATHSHGAILDLVLVNNPFLISNLTVSEPLSTSDHFSLTFSVVSASEEPHVIGHKRKNLQRCEPSMSFLDSVNWDALFCDCVDIEDYWEVFKSVITFCLEHLVPEVPSTPLSKRSFRLSSETISLIRARRSAWSRYRRTRDPIIRRSFQRLSRICSNLLRKDRYMFESSLVNTGNQRSFFGYIKRQLRQSRKIPPITAPNAETLCDDFSKCREFNDYYASVYKSDNGILPAFGPRTQSSLGFVHFTYSSVARALKSVSKSYSSGPDQIPSMFVYSVRDCIVSPLCTIFTVCFHQGRLPQDWLDASVVPVYKGKGGTNRMENYRPISLTSVVCKVMERCVKERITSYLLENRLLSNSQHGFVHNRSTLTNLLEACNDWINMLQDRKCVDVIYFDIKKAFDTVSHKKLLFKCETYGINGNLLAYLKAFLSNRRQRVQIQGSYSQWSPVVSGVPQGSVLGPLLFLLYVNDAPDSVTNSLMKLFADDTKIYRSFSPRVVTNELQSDVTSYVNWCDDWQLDIHPGKCSVLKLGNFPRAQASYAVHDVEIAVSNTVRDLGVMVSSNLRFSDHCAFISKKASMICGLILRAFSSRSLQFMVKAFVVYVRPVLEYCSEVWSPSYLSDIERVESVQRNFTRRIVGLSGCTYVGRLSECKLESLELRRLKKDLLLVYKMFNGRFNVRFTDFFTVAYSGSTRGHSLKLYPKLSCTDRALNSFAFRVVNVWNSLPSSVIESSSVNLFKSRLDAQTDILLPWLRGRAYKDV